MKQTHGRLFKTFCCVQKNHDQTYQIIPRAFTKKLRQVLHQTI